MPAGQRGPRHLGGLPAAGRQHPDGVAGHGPDVAVAVPVDRGARAAVRNGDRLMGQRAEPGQRAVVDDAAVGRWSSCPRTGAGCRPDTAIRLNGCWPMASGFWMGCAAVPGRSSLTRPALLMKYSGSRGEARHQVGVMGQAHERPAADGPDAAVHLQHDPPGHRGLGVGAAGQRDHQLSRHLLELRRAGPGRGAAQVHRGRLAVDVDAPSSLVPGGNRDSVSDPMKLDWAWLVSSALIRFWATDAAEALVPS